MSKLAFAEDAHLMGGAERADNNFNRVSDATNCGKLLALERLLAIWHKAADKVLLFSCSTRLLDILEKFLARRGQDLTDSPSPPSLYNPPCTRLFHSLATNPKP